MDCLSTTKNTKVACYNPDAVEKKDDGCFHKIHINKTTYKTYSISLKEQFRISASEEVTKWIQEITVDASDEEPIGEENSTSNSKGPHISNIPKDDGTRPKEDRIYASNNNLPYEIKVFDSPQELREAIDKKRNDLNKEQQAERKKKKLSPSASMRGIFAVFSLPTTGGILLRKEMLRFTGLVALGQCLRVGIRKTIPSLPTTGMRLKVASFL